VNKAVAKPRPGSVKVVEQEPIPSANEQAAREEMTNRMEQLGVNAKDKKGYADAADDEKEEKEAEREEKAKEEEERFRQQFSDEAQAAWAGGLPPPGRMQVISGLRAGQSDENVGPQRLGDLFAPTEAVTDATSADQQDWASSLEGGELNKLERQWDGDMSAFIQLGAQSGQKLRARAASAVEQRMLGMAAMQHRAMARARAATRALLRDDDDEGGGDDEKKEEDEPKDADGGLNLGNPEVANMMGLIPDQTHPKFGTSFVGDGNPTSPLMQATTHTRQLVP
jgi:hypothetical protein